MDDFNRIVRAFVAGRHAEALAMIQARPAGTPENAATAALHGLTLAALGRAGEAVACFRRASELQPDDAGHRINLGNALRESGDNAAAIEALESAVARGAGGPELDLNLGLAYLQANRVAEAAGRLDRAARAMPGNLHPRVHLARALSELGEREAALQAVAGIPVEALADADLLNQFGIVLNQTGDGTRAEDALKRALALDPDLHEATQNLAAMYERQNRIVEARQLLDTLPDGVDNATLSLLRAKIASRGKDYPQALDHYRRAERLRLDDRLRIDLHFDRGKAHDSLGDIDAAMADFQAGHAASMALLRLQYPDIDSYPEADDWEARDAEGPTHARPAFRDGLPQDPVFVVGFPRSGTTLLEQLLDAHPNLQSMDEQLAIESAIDELRVLGHRYPQDIDRLDAATLTSVRQHYWQEVGKVVELRAGARLVDKYPFNAVRLPMIAQAFPEARVIMLLRHPADACLSCYMQKFRLNIGTRYWASLETTTALYARMMATWLAHSAATPVPVHTLRYEDLVADMPRHMRALLDFLDLPWDDRILGYAERAKSRGRISTPSYSQVVEPIYSKAIGRWQRYASHLAPYLPTLEPFIERFGYRETTQ